MSLFHGALLRFLRIVLSRSLLFSVKQKQNKTELKTSACSNSRNYSMPKTCVCWPWRTKAIGGSGAYHFPKNPVNSRLRVVSNFGDSSEIHARTKMGSREETGAPRVNPFSCTRVYFTGIAKLVRDSQTSIKRSPSGNSQLTA